MDQLTTDTQRMLSDDSGGAAPRESSGGNAQARERTSPDNSTGRVSTAVPTDRTYECLDCGFVVDSFFVACPGCGNTAFETTTPDDETGAPTPFDPLLAATATLTAPVNPYVPR